MTQLLATLQAMAWLEFVGLVSGLACVWLLIRQNLWTFPIGLCYALVSVVVFLKARLYADVLLNAYYVLMNAYGWYFWLNASRGGGTPPAPVDDAPASSAPDDAPLRRALSADAATVPVAFCPANTRWWLAGLVAVATAAMGGFLDTQTDADLPYWDSATTTMSFAAMWMTARKYIDSWVVWLVVDVIATVMYVYKGIGFYALLYGIYLVMAVAGWRAWRRSMPGQAAR